MRIIHTADLHLDSSLETNLDSVKTKERKRELLLTFQRLVNYAKDNKVDAILIAGDMFDKPRVSIKTKEFIMNIIESNREIDFIYVSGNHDELAFLNTIDYKPDNLYTFDSKWKTLSYDNVDISGIVLDNTPSKIIYDTLCLNKDKVNIVAMHGPIGSSEKEINISLLKNKHIDYLALGHIHKYQKEALDNRGSYAYCGCLEGRGFDEIGPKGFILVDIIGNNVKTEFIPFAKRELREIVVDITNLDNWLEIRKNISLKLNGIPYTDMVKVKLVGYYDLDLIKQIELLDETLNEEYYFARVEDSSRLKINPKDYENDISLKGEFIRNVLSSDLSIDDKNNVIEYGIKALMKEEI